MSEDEGASAPFSFSFQLQDLPAICMKCSHKLAEFNGYCDFCYVEDEPDVALVVGDR